MFPNSPPVGFLLRQLYNDRWLRIHSLPESKRYAQTECEHKELLRRHNRVATDVHREGSTCFLIQSKWTKQKLSSSSWIVDRNIFSGESLSYALDSNLKIEVSSVVWKSGQFDSLLIDVADWKVTMILFVSISTKCVYAPYDGGVDLILRNEQEREKKKIMYKNWLSAHPEGL